MNLVTIGLTIAAMTLLFRQNRSVLDMWLLVALSGWIFQSLLNITLQTRFTLGWYGLIVMTLAASFIVMLALIARDQSALRAAGPLDRRAEAGTRGAVDVDGRGDGRHLP